MHKISLGLGFVAEENFFATSSAPKLENYRVSQQVWNRLKAMFWSLDMFANEASSVYEKMYFLRLKIVFWAFFC